MRRSKLKKDRQHNDQKKRDEKNNKNWPIKYYTES